MCVQKHLLLLVDDGSKYRVLRFSWKGANMCSAGFCVQVALEVCFFVSQVALRNQQHSKFSFSMQCFVLLENEVISAGTRCWCESRL